MTPAALARRFLSGVVFRQGGLVLADQGLLSITNFLTGVLVARACTTSEYGIYVLAWSGLMIALTVYKALVHIPFAVLLPRLAEREGRYYQGSAFLQTALIAFAAGLLTLSVGRIWFSTEGSEFAKLLPVIGAVAVLFVPFIGRDFARDALFARLQFRSSIAVSILATTLQLVAVAWLYITGGLGLLPVLGVMFVTSTLAAGLMLWMHRDQMTIQLARLARDFQRGWHMSRWSLLNTIGMIGTSQAYPWLLAGLVGTSETAVFGAAMAVAAVAAPFVQAANAYVLPRMSHGLKSGTFNDLRRMLRRATVGLALPYGAWVMVGGVFADPIMTALYSDRYAGFGPVVVLLLLRSMVEAVSSPLNPALQTLERTRVTTVALFLGTLVTLTVGWYAIEMLNIVGAAAAALLTSIVTAAYKFWRFRQLVSYRSRDPA